MDPDDTATLLLGLSSAVHADARGSDGHQSGPPEAAPLPQSPRCTPAVVAAALMSASHEQDALVAADPTKNRRLQVSALPRKEWSAEEDALIRSGVEQLGCRWRVIAAQLPGRSDDAVRNRWSRLQESLRGGSTQNRKAGADAEGFSPGSSVDAAVPERGASVGGGASHKAAGGSATSGGSGSSGDGLDGSGGGIGDGGIADDVPAVARDGAATSGGRVNGTSIVGSANGASGASASGASASGSGGGGGRAGSGAAKNKGDGVKGGGSSGGKARRVSSDGGAGSDANGVEKKERTSWTRAEDDVIIQGVAELGHKWYEIARRLPGRTDHAIRNRWSRLQSIIGMQSIGGADASTKLASPRLPPSMPVGMDPATSVLPPVSAAFDLSRTALSVPLPPPPQSSQSAASLQVLSHTATDAPAATAVLAGGAAGLLLKPSAPPPPLQRPDSSDAPMAQAATLSMAALASLRRADGNGASATNGAAPIPPWPKPGDGTSGATSEGSDAELTTGTAELLLLQSGSGVAPPSSQPSPQITATARSADECPDMGDPGQSSAADLLLINKRPRV